MATPLDTKRADNTKLLKTRIPTEMKVRLAALAKRRGINKSTLMRQLIANALGESMPIEELGADVHQPRAPEQRRVAARLNAADRRALRDRAKARNVTMSRYLAALIRAHLRNDIRPLAAEMAMMRELIVELNRLSTGLNHLVRAANEGVVWAAPLKEILEQILGEFQKLGVRLGAFGQASREPWKADVVDNDL